MISVKLTLSSREIPAPSSDPSTEIKIDHRFDPKPQYSFDATVAEREALLFLSAHLLNALQLAKKKLPLHLKNIGRRCVLLFEDGEVPS